MFPSRPSFFVAPIVMLALTMSSSAERLPENLFSGLSYSMVGPSRGGRVTAVAGHRAQPSTFYMGASGGGVWKTTNYGNSWNPISDGFFATGSIGAIRVAESDPNIVYVSTGSDGLRSNVIIGTGVYKSTDAGKTWKNIGLEKTGNSGAILVHPENADLVYVAAIGNPFASNPERGVYRTSDGGKNWELILFVSDKTGAVDLEFAPDNANDIYATMWEAERKPWTIVSGGMEGGLYKTTDGGDNWTRLSDGLPTGLRGKADLAVSAAAPDRVYVLIEADKAEQGVYRSDDRGETWSHVSDFQPIINRPFYYCNLEAHPENPDILWGMAEGYWKSEDGGKNWERRRVPHGDNHDMWINPDNPDLFIQSNDGGANVTLDGGDSWSTQNNQPTAELYQVDISSEFPYRLYAGQQDNSTISVPSLPPLSMPAGHIGSWEAHGGCETGPAVPKPGDPDIVYANCKGRFGLFNRRTGQEQQYYVGFGNLYGHNPKDLEFRFQRVSPIHVSPHDPNRVYHTSQYVHVTENGGKTWQVISPDLTAFTDETQVVSGGPITIDVTGEEHFSVIYEIQESPLEPGVIWVGANDGPIQVTRDNGKSWKNVTPPNLGPYGRVQNIEVSPHTPARAYATILRYQVGDFEPHIYKTSDYGESWTRIINGIPMDHPVRVVREDPDREGLLYAGTEFGMFVSFDDGAEWQPFQLNLPVTPITDMKIVDKDLVISTMGRSFWILYDLTPMHEISSQIASAKAHLFNTKDAYRLFTRRGFNSESTPDEPQYPSPGVNVDYFLSDAASALTLDIVDSAGHVVRSYSSEGPGESMELDELASMHEWQMQKVGTPKLPSSPGFHRFRWDLRHAGAWDPNEERSGRRGPMVAPGRYQARLSLGDWSSSVDFEAKMDPRVVQEGWVTSAEVTEQIELCLKSRDALSAAQVAAERLKKAREAGTLDAALQEVYDAMVTVDRRYSQPMLVDQLSYLYSNLNRADQKPGKDAVQRYEQLASELQQHLSTINAALGTDQ